MRRHLALLVLVITLAVVTLLVVTACAGQPDAPGDSRDLPGYDAQRSRAMPATCPTTEAQP